MTSEGVNFAGLVASIAQTHALFAAQASKAINVSLTLRNWLIGHHIAEYELRGADRADYGQRLLERLGQQLGQAGLKRIDARELRRFRQFYSAYPQIREAVTPVLAALPVAQRLGLPNAYVGYYQQHEMTQGDQPPVGILLCTQKNHEMVQHTLAGMTNKLFVSRYQLALPAASEMEAFLRRPLGELGVDDGGGGV